MPSQWDVLEGAQLRVNVLEVRQCSGAAVPVWRNIPPVTNVCSPSAVKWPQEVGTVDIHSALDVFVPCCKCYFFCSSLQHGTLEGPLPCAGLCVGLQGGLQGCVGLQLARACLSDTEGSLVVWRAPALKSIVAFNKRSQGRASFL